MEGSLDFPLASQVELMVPSHPIGTANSSIFRSRLPLNNKTDSSASLLSGP